MFSTIFSQYPSRSLPGVAGVALQLLAATLLLPACQSEGTSPESAGLGSGNGAAHSVLDPGTGTEPNEGSAGAADSSPEGDAGDETSTGGSPSTDEGTGGVPGSGGEVNIDPVPAPDPEWTKRIQLYGHGFSVPNDFTEDEYEFIANTYDIFTVEKRHAYNSYGPMPNSEAATIGACKKLKEINPEIEVLLYWNFILDWGFYESQTEFSQHPEWVYGQWTFGGTGNVVDMYDLNNPSVQEWWVDAIVDPVLRGDLDGVFLDAGPKVPGIMHEDLFELIDEVRERIGEDKVVVYNGYRVPNPKTMQAGPDFLEHTTGVFIEFWLNSPLETKEEAVLLFDELITAYDAGKTIIPRGTPHSILADFPGTEEEAFDFTFASFLLFYGPNSYYIYNWGYEKDQGMLEYHPEHFDIATGKSLGSPERDGWIYTREFENISVVVDLENQTAAITHK